MKHTPTPWRSMEVGWEGARILPDCEDKRERRKYIAIVDGRDTPTDFANARFIVRAVNAFEPMLEACKVSLQALYAHRDVAEGQIIRSAIASLEATIEKAEPVATRRP